MVVENVAKRIAKKTGLFPRSNSAPAASRMAFRANDKMQWHRYELKYLICQAKAAAIEHFIRPFLHLDHYGRSKPDRAYPIVSLYLDSDNLELCRQSLEGHKNRFKLRIRSYTDEVDYPRFFEIKRRLNTVIIKSRARVMQRDIEAFLSGSLFPTQDYPDDENMLRQFQLYMNSVNAAPVVRIRYMRQAYEDDSDNRVRVTFDRRLCCNISRNSDISLSGSGWEELLQGYVILEVKFTGRYPAWLSRMAKYFNLQQQSVSKYTHSMKKMCSSRLYTSKIPIKAY